MSTSFLLPGWIIIFVFLPLSSLIANTHNLHPGITPAVAGAAVHSEQSGEKSSGQFTKTGSDRKFQSKQHKHKYWQDWMQQATINFEHFGIWPWRLGKTLRQGSLMASFYHSTWTQRCIVEKEKSLFFLDLTDKSVGYHARFCYFNLDSLHFLEAGGVWIEVIYPRPALSVQFSTLSCRLKPNNLRRWRLIQPRITEIKEKKYM